MNKRIIILIGLCLLISCAGLIAITVNESTEWGYYFFDIGLAVGQLLGFIMVISHGTIIGTVYWRIILIFLGITLFGALLKILHYAYADQSLMIGVMGVAITYLIRFLAKKEKGHLDFFKLLWVLSAHLGGALIVLHIIPKDLAYLIQVTFWIVLLDFVWLQFKAKSSR